MPAPPKRATYKPHFPMHVPDPLAHLGAAPNVAPIPIAKQSLKSKWVSKSQYTWFLHPSCADFVVQKGIV